ncbi:MAG: TlpA family protein disulfide reductase [Flavobacteriaceae bacterium]|nr:TlpA family protein disulfide reductase [Flavobacteriaceae bacterium]
MKNLFSIVFVLFIALGYSQERIPQKIYKKANAINGLIEENEIEKAVAYTLDVHQEGKALWVNQMHSNYSPQISRDTKSTHLYFSELQKLEIQEIKEFSFPIYLWSQSFALNELNSEDILELYPKALQNAKWEARTETYVLLALKNLASKNLITNQELITGIQACIDQLEPQIITADFLTDHSESKLNSWKKYVLTYSYYLLSQVDANNTEKNFQKAFHYSPNSVDEANSNYFFDNLLLTGTTDKLNIPGKYYTFLVENEEPDDEKRKVLEKRAFATPTNYNLNLLRNHIENSHSEIDFKSYWQGVFNKEATPLSKAMETELTILLGEDLKGKWWFVDFWGTWCSPCIEDLPIVEKIYINASQTSTNNFKVQTFSYLSRKLDKFMSKNEYSFPVKEIEENSVQQLNVKGFPTKLLISPEGNFIKLNLSRRWDQYVKNYVLLD